jgi:tripartite-type tricarboxylate transporter receptor subunit TctC
MVRIIACVLFWLLAGAAWGQAYPTRPITLYVPFVPGPTDTAARKVAEVASRHLGQPIVIENKPGAGGTLAPALMARSAKPDGYLLSVIPSSLFRYHFMQKVDWEPLRDFTYIAGLTEDDMSIQVANDSPFRSFDDVVKYAKANPGKLTYGTPGLGTSMHLLTETAAAQLGIQITHVPYKGASELVRALITNETMITVDTAGAIQPQVAAGKARYLVQFSAKRVPWMPEVPTAKELGLDFVYTVAVGLAGPKDLPAPIVNRIAEAFQKGVQDPETVKLMDTLKKDPWPVGPAAYTAFAKKSVEQERKMVERSGLMAK